MNTRTLSRWLMSIGLAVFALIAIHLLVATSPTQGRRATGLINCSRSIQACIDAANDGDTILIAAGTYTESLTLSKPVSLTGENRDTTIIHAVEGQRVLTVTGATISNSVVISGLMFTEGNLSGESYCSEYCGGGMLVTDRAQLTIQNVIFSNNTTSGAGGGIYDGSIYGGGTTAVTLIDSQFISNSADLGGGGLAVSDTDVTLVNTHFISNTAIGEGGGVRVNTTDTIRISGGRFERNTATNGGGGVYAGFAMITSTEFISNTAFGDGGGIYIYEAATVTNSHFENNVALGDYGGAIETPFGTLVISQTHFISNTSNNSGGAFHAAQAVIHNSRFERNSARLGNGAILVGELTLSDGQFVDNRCLASNCEAGALGVWPGSDTPVIAGTTFIGNVALGRAGAIYAIEPVIISNTQFISNSSGTNGGGLFADNGVTLTNVDFISNTALQYGGGAYIASTAILTNVQFISNTASGTGGGLYSIGNSHVTNVLFTNNRANLDGAALALYGNGRNDLLYTTIADTVNNPRAAIAVVSSTLGITDTIIANHAVAISNTNGAIYEDYNHIFNTITNTVGMTSGGHSLIGDPKFADPLNGDYHLQLGSAAIDHSIDAGVYTDLDGNPRPKNLGFDIGAMNIRSASFIYRCR
jgi:predicted outer membrane repeat protein